MKDISRYRDMEQDGGEMENEGQRWWKRVLRVSARNRRKLNSDEVVVMAGVVVVVVALVLSMEKR
jgi:hypothetical protein